MSRKISRGKRAYLLSLGAEPQPRPMTNREFRASVVRFYGQMATVGSAGIAEIGRYMARGFAMGTAYKKS